MPAEGILLFGAIMEIDYENLHRVLTKYGQEKWGGLKTPIEDVVQETLIKIFEKSDELKDYDRQHLEGYACLTLKYTALTTLLEEHKKGLWIQNSDLLDNGYSIYELTNDNVSFLNDPWLDEFYKSKRERDRINYQKNKEQFATYYQKHKEERSAYSKKYYQEHKEAHARYNREYRTKDVQRYKELYKKYSSKYYKKHRERKLKYQKELKQDAHIIQNEVFEEYNIKITIEKCKKLVTAKRKSEEIYKERLKQMISDSRSF